ncbi:nuclear transport factor 2 family protein [Bailinhaonella thermotolerans]|uniref:Nuclear transport factor 2 family protein n=1 Tax=Bailinhaonella thermotolerans TaxID=1070861 RepID=A0A3A4A4Y3_9ACTN|nr:nuclear transport factor 2 family protein [Bailinhaonella thermotolerans]RJL23876.1 nuclear transport factor 2 family protein [Bailinhaonella thermotolerans]
MSYADLIHRFIDAINDTDAVRRRATIEEILTPDCTYTDPEIAVEGHDALDRAFAALQQRIPPGFRFGLTAPVDAHHHQARFFWRFGDPEAGTPAATGSDVAVFADGRIRHLYAFFDAANS